MPRISSTRKELLKAACRQKSALRLVNTQVAQYRSGTLTQPRAGLVCHFEREDEVECGDDDDCI